MLKILLKLLIVLFLLNLSVFADVFEHPETIENIVKTIPTLNDIDCKFHQEKHLANSSTVLKSGGNFSFKKDKGITFDTIYPIKSTTSYNKNENKEINDIILALSNKKYNKIKYDFDFFFQQESKNWIIGLKPKKNSTLKNYLASIEIKGNKDISRITIVTNNGIKTVIWFYKQDK